jgi:NADH:ubiquinone oxidoreductase subunit 6 (subunit J)
MAFSLIISLGSTAGLFFLLGADFVAATQLLVYVGGTLVLLIFGVMLTASGPFRRIRMSTGETLLGAAVGLLFFSVIAFTVLSVNWQAVPSYRDVAASPSQQTGNTSRSIGLRLVGIPADSTIGLHAGRGSNTSYLLPFEIVSVHLLVVLIGAAYLARAKRRESTDAEPEDA